MKSNEEIISFNNPEEAKLLLSESRKRIDEIDNEIVSLISERTSLAKDIALSKNYLGKPIYDKSREDSIHEKVVEMANEYDLDDDILNQIINMLTILSKNEQEEILRRSVNGQY